MRLRPRAEVICFKDSKVLAAYAPDAKGGYVYFPGGGVEPNESPIAAAKREGYEESDRIISNCTPAHPPTTQIWPKGYGRPAWADAGYEGGLTYWMTGSTSVDRVHRTLSERHHDFEPRFEWKPVDEVLRRLRHEHGGWEDDAKVRLAIIEAHQRMHEVHKVAEPAPGVALRLPTLRVVIS